ncbi:MAG: aminotransferase class III-fold pyridoxal phosphate-dependent enzyme [Deltaproteobacteria bacterium]|nr:aminotransferase class III-fold pyridoxal phosphate-dependent enzyme [Deltaproteobacteria bacterium]
MATELNVVEITRKHTYGTWRPQKGWMPMHVTRAEGVHFWDAAGTRYLDMSAQLMCSNLGHQNPAVVDAICKQARELAFVAPGYATTVRAQLAQKLLDVVPKGIDKFFFATSGTEANECAIKMARLVTGKQKIIARYNSYHGSTASSVAATGDYRRWFAEPLDAAVPSVIHAPECNTYRPAVGTTASESAEYFDYILRNEGNVAAIIMEPIVGTNGVLVPPADYLPRVKAIAEKYGVLLIADEVMSGWGRTGAWFAVDHWNVVPDILVTAKGVTSAMAPLGVVGTTRKVADYFEEGWFAHGHTYESHPLTLAPAVAAIDEYKRLDLINGAKRMGEKFGPKLRKLMDSHPSVGDVRGLGLFWCVELVKNRKTKEPFNTFHDKYARKPLLIDQVTGALLKQGVSMMGWMSHLIIAPPLIITEAQLDEAVAALDVALKIADEKVA